MWFKKTKRFKRTYKGNVYTEAEFISIIYEESKELPESLREKFIDDVLRSYQIRTGMTKKDERLVVYITGIIFFFLLIGFSVVFPEPTPFQYAMCRIVMAFAAAAAITFVPGFLEVNIHPGVRAGGAIAAFLIVYFYAPAALGEVVQKLPQ